MQISTSKINWHLKILRTLKKKCFNTVEIVIISDLSLKENNLDIGRQKNCLRSARINALNYIKNSLIQIKMVRIDGVRFKKSMRRHKTCSRGKLSQMKTCKLSLLNIRTLISTLSNLGNLNTISFPMIEM